MKELVESKVMVGFFILFILVIYINSMSIKKLEEKSTNENNTYVKI